MQFDAFSFGSIEIDDTTYDHDVMIDRGKIRKRKKQPSKKFWIEYGHTPLSVEEEIPLEVPSARGGHRRLRPLAGDEGREARSRSPKG